MSRSAAPVEPRQRSLLLMAAVCAVVSASKVRAADLDFTWTAPPQCPSKSAVQARIHELAGAAHTRAARLRADATISRNARGGLHLKLVVQSDDLIGERELDGTSCADLAGATAVNVVLLLESLQPQSTEPQASDTPTPTPTPTPSVQAAVEAPPARSEESTPRAWRVLLRAPLASLSIGLFPEPSVGLALAAGLQVEHWQLLAVGSAQLPRTLPALAAAATGASVTRAQVGLRACRDFSLAALSFGPCAELAWHPIWARGEGRYVTPSTAKTALLAVAVGAQARWQLAPWFGLIAYLEASWYPSRPRIVIDGLGRVEPLGPVALGLSFGTEWIL